jgi:hypothetical protein
MSSRVYVLLLFAISSAQPPKLIALWEKHCHVSDVLNFCVADVHGEALIGSSYRRNFLISAHGCFKLISSARHCQMTNADAEYYFRVADTTDDFHYFQMTLAMQCYRCMQDEFTKYKIPDLVPFPCTAVGTKGKSRADRENSCEQRCAQVIGPKYGRPILTEMCATPDHATICDVATKLNSGVLPTTYFNGTNMDVGPLLHDPSKVPTGSREIDTCFCMRHCDNDSPHVTCTAAGLSTAEAGVLQASYEICCMSDAQLKEKYHWMAPNQ